MTLKRIAITAAATGAIVALSSSAAFAQDCFIVKRSDQGSASVANSSRWISITVADMVGATGACATDLDAALSAAGLPTVLATRADKTLLEGTGADANGKTADGKGIDHFEESPVVGEIFGVAGDVLANDSACA